MGQKEIFNSGLIQNLTQVTIYFCLFLFPCLTPLESVFKCNISLIQSEIKLRTENYY